jgi:hypothetical protein
MLGAQAEAPRRSRGFFMGATLDLLPAQGNNRSLCLLRKYGVIS